MGEGPDKARRERETKDATAARRPREERHGEAEASFAPKHAAQVSEIFILFYFILCFFALTDCGNEQVQHLVTIVLLPDIYSVLFFCLS